MMPPFWAVVRPPDTGAVVSEGEGVELGMEVTVTVVGNSGVEVGVPFVQLSWHPLPTKQLRPISSSTLRSCRVAYYSSVSPQ